MVRLAVKIDASQFDKYLRDAPEKVARAIGNMVQKVALLVEREAKILAPVDTGRLRSSIGTDIHPLHATVEPHVNYAVFVHEGTRFISPRPFMGDAAETVDKLIPEIMQKELKVLE